MKKQRDDINSIPRKLGGFKETVSWFAVLNKKVFMIVKCFKAMSK